jgi:hypothetical protein
MPKLSNAVKLLLEEDNLDSLILQDRMKIKILNNKAPKVPYGFEDIFKMLKDGNTTDFNAIYKTFLLEKEFEQQTKAYHVWQIFLPFEKRYYDMSYKEQDEFEILAKKVKKAINNKLKDLKGKLKFTEYDSGIHGLAYYYGLEKVTTQEWSKTPETLDTPWGVYFYYFKWDPTAVNSKGAIIGIEVHFHIKRQID